VRWNRKLTHVGIHYLARAAKDALAQLWSDVLDVLAGASPPQRHGEPAPARDALSDAKLDTPSRARAVDRARELGLLAPSSRLR
jgi:hypothetical protein